MKHSKTSATRYDLSATVQFKFTGRLISHSFKATITPCDLSAAILFKLVPERFQPRTMIFREFKRIGQTNRTVYNQPKSGS